MRSMTGFGRSSSRSTGPTETSSKSTGTEAGASKTARTKSKAVVKAVSENGPGAASAAELEVSIRAVNGRYLEVRFHLPREYASLESDFKAKLSETFSRGTIDIYVNRKRPTGASLASEVAVNSGLAKKWLKAYRDLGKELKLTSSPSLEMISRLPDVLSIEEPPEVSEAEKELALRLVAEASQACDQERKREGRALQTELLGLCEKLETLSDQIESLKSEAKAELEKRFRDRLRDGDRKSVV